ncbi:MAG: hypothetical protein JNM88_00595, partial [Chitinophagaceae bacterium]|nr:hypothetical protein [Chitinophagaceae bacterium]
MQIKLIKTASPATAVAGQTSTVCEPSVGVRGNSIFYTGNWFAAKSTDNGANWTFISPYTQLAPPGSLQFCCDQTVIYDPSRKLTIWLLQYSADATGENVLRVAVNKSTTLADNGWYWWDLKPSLNIKWKAQWFDYNHAALSSNYLYVGTNVFNSSNKFTRGLVFRLSLDELANSASNLKFDHFESTSFSLRCTQGATGTMYFGSQRSDKELNVFEWKESSKVVKEYHVPVTAFKNGTYTANCPDGRNWLNRCDERITGAWVSKGVIGFMWTANKQAGRPYPFVRVVRITASNMTKLDEPDIWSPNLAYAYPDSSPNADGTVGISILFGGGTKYPSHAVGAFDDATKKWVLQVNQSGTHTSADLKWGDYVTCRQHSPSTKTWAASGFILKGGSSRTSIQPLYVQFGL